MPDTAGEPITYALDASDRIIRVNDAWTRFALENDAPELAAHHVLERSIWDLLDSPTREIYAAVVARVRDGRTLRFSLRCDSPALRRTLNMVVAPAERHSLIFQCVIVAIEPRATQPIWDRRATRGATLVRTCAWCKKVDVGGEWREIEDAVEPLGIFEAERLPSVTHGICDACQRMMDIVTTT